MRERGTCLGRSRMRLTDRIGASWRSALLLAIPLASAAQQPMIEVAPRPIGAAAALVGTRGDGVPAELPTSGMVEVPPGPPATTPVTSRTGEFFSTTYQLSESRLFYAPVLTSSPAPVAPPAPAPAPAPSPAPPTPPPSTGSSNGSDDSDDDEEAPSKPTPKSKEQLAVEKQRHDAEREHRGRVYDLLKDRMDELGRIRKDRSEAEAAKLKAERDVQGPTALGAIDLLDGLRIDPGVPLERSDILQVDHQVYQDANPQTGLFYYLPKRFDLEWTPESQYAMTVIYGMAGRTADEGQVFMAARLQAGVDLREIQVAQNLLVAYIRRHAGERVIKLRELRPLPLEQTSDIKLFGGAKNEFAIPSDAISVQGITGLLHEIDVSWATDVRRLLNVESLLRTDAGIHGSVTLHAAAEEDLVRAVPLEFAVATPSTFGRIPFDRVNGWSNQSFYPITLKRLHALLINPAGGPGGREGDPVILTWDLGETRVPPGTRVFWNTLGVPPWLEKAALLVWASYAVDGACEACDEHVFDEKFIPSPPATRELKFTSGDLFEATKAFRVSVYLRSPFFDPKRTQIQEPPPIAIPADGKEVAAAQLFLSPRELEGEGGSQPLYEYAVEIVMRDGTSYRTEWTPSRQLDMALGSAALEKQLGFLPRAQSE